MNLLFTLDSNYVPHFKVALKSLFLNNPQKPFDIYLIYSDITENEIKSIKVFIERHYSSFYPVFINEDMFADAPITGHYSAAMYYRLMAHTLLDQSLNKILYIDPDTLIINSIDELYQTDLSEHLYAAASHSAILPGTDSINKVRLGTFDAKDYFNTGVLLINLERCRKEVKKKDIFRLIEDHGDELILPDQDVFNALYGTRTKPVDDLLYNFDARYTDNYVLRTLGKIDMDWIMENTVILHFCGKKKPWHKNHMNRYAMLYKHYMVMAKR